jgi:hypothetical protein
VAVELPEAAMTVGDEGAHAARLGERQRLAVVSLAALGVEPVGVGCDVAQQVPRIDRKAGSRASGGLEMTWKPVVLLAIGVSVLLRLEPVEVVVYLDGAPGPASIDAIVTEAACRYIRAEEVPLPLPYTVRVLKRAGESLRFTPQPAPIATGLLSWCPGAVSALPALSGPGSGGPESGVPR